MAAQNDRLALVQVDHQHVVFAKAVLRLAQKKLTQQEIMTILDENEAPSRGRLSRSHRLMPPCLLCLENHAWNILVQGGYGHDFAAHG